MSEDLEKIKAIIASHLEQAAQEIRGLVQPHGGFSTPDAESLTSNGQLVVRIQKVDNETRFLPVESLRIKKDVGTIKGFLVPKILENLKKKHGLNYQILGKGDLLKAVVVYGPIAGKQLKELKSGVAWAFHRASFPKEQKKQEKIDRATLDVEEKFPADLHDMLNFQVEGEYVTMRPKAYLASDVFRRIAAIVQNELNGHYISQGANSHFRVKK